MATKKQPVDKLYVLIDADGDAVEIGPLDIIEETVKEICEDVYSDISDFTICELGPKKKITFIPSSLKIG
jgi:hypothetical protein